MRVFLLLFSLLLANPLISFSQLNAKDESVAATVSGTLMLDNSWEREIYLCHIPSFNSRNEIASQMIIAKAPIDSLGNFKIRLDFLPDSSQLYRLHIVKKGDSPASLIIGGQNENHLFLALNSHTQVALKNDTTLPPFRNVVFSKESENQSLNALLKLYTDLDLKASSSNAYTRKLINEQLMAKLLVIADSSEFVLTSLFATYLHQNMRTTEDNDYAVILNRWKNSGSPYLKDFAIVEKETRSYFGYLTVVGLGIILLGSWFLIIRKPKKSALQELSVQERKVFMLLKEGKSNQEISDECSIAISTVKTHVSNIYGKLNISSRKDAMNYSD